MDIRQDTSVPRKMCMHEPRRISHSCGSNAPTRNLTRAEVFSPEIRTKQKEHTFFCCDSKKCSAHQTIVRPIFCFSDRAVRRFRHLVVAKWSDPRAFHFRAASLRRSAATHNRKYWLLFVQATERSSVRSSEFRSTFAFDSPRIGQCIRLRPKSS